MKLDSLEIEITRDCNLSCPHCMRYELDEPMSKYRGTVISKEVIDKLFDKCKSIRFLVFTGGEPMLHPEMISYIVDKFIEKQVDIKYINMITNGTICSEEGIEALNKAYKYIRENCFDHPPSVILGISVGLHDNEKTIQKVLEFYKERAIFDEVKLVNEFLEEPKKVGLTYAGRAKQLHEYYPLPEAIQHRICMDEEGTILCQLDLTVSGNFVIASSHSFQDADKPENIICSIDDDFLLKLTQWNYKHPLTCKEAGETIFSEHVLKNNEWSDEELTEEDKEHCQTLLAVSKYTEKFRKEIHDYYPYLYPDDIQIFSNISNAGKVPGYLLELSAMTRNEKRKQETEADLSVWCTCPNKD